MNDKQELYGVDEALHEKIMAAAAEVEGWGEAAERFSRDEVNQPHINDWLEALDYSSTRFRAGEAPPAMAQVWTMYGLRGEHPDRDPLHAMMNVLTNAGFTGVLGTNSEQTYDRYLRVGERVRVTTALDSVVGPKRTGMGVGYFVTSRSTWYVCQEDGHSERVASMLFRVFKFIPRKADS